jgi:ABC-type transport system involved in multi-copper enzyme maturation permease subunit
VLYNVFLLGVLLLGVAYTSSQLTFISAERVVLDFGYTSLQISFTLFGILLGAQLLTREFDQRTVWVTLSKPISRLEFVLGKFLGFMSLLTVSLAILVLLHALLFWKMGGDLSLTYLVGFCFLWLQSVLLGALALAISSLSTPSLAFLVSLGLFLIGSNHSQIPLLFFRDQELLQEVARVVLWLFPKFELYQLGLNLTYHQPLSILFIGMATLHACLWVVVLLMLSTIGILKKESS